MSCFNLQIMSEINMCQIVNSVDKINMTLLTKWSENNLEILILRDKMEPLSAEVSVELLLQNAEHFKQSKDDFLLEIKKELAGNDTDIKFYLKDGIFYWKKKIWNRAKFPCKPVKDIITFSDIIHDILHYNITTGKEMNKLLTENESYKNRFVEMEKIVKKTMEIKNSIEDELYSKFILLLNTKKSKILELEQELKEYHRKNSPTVFDLSTDVSDEEIENSHPTIVKKNKTNEQSLIIKKDISQTIENGIEIESDESFELKYEETQEMTTKNVSKLNITDEVPEEDLFSQ